MGQKEWRKPVILIVEDEPIVLETVAADLQDSGFEVLRARTGEEACRLLETENRLDLVMTDISLPGKIDGWQVAVLARATWASMPVIYVSGDIESDPRMVEGATIVTKPYHLDALIEAARALGVKSAR